MKSITLLLILLLAFKTSSSGFQVQQKPIVKDTASKPQAVKPAAIDTQKLLLKGLVEQTKAIKTNTDTLAKRSKGTCMGCQNLKFNWGEWILVFSPLVLLLIAILIFISAAKNLNLKDALTENELPKIIRENPLYTAENIVAIVNNPNGTTIPPVIEVTDSTCPYRQSTSRYIAFFTSILTLIIALCLTCFFIYEYIRTGCAPEVGELSSVLIALGIGVIPYAFNKVATAIESKKTE